MASLRERFEHFYAPDEIAVATALRTGLITPDTNVLLNLYRFHRDAREDLFRALEKIGDRLWIPHQVALEFYRDRLKVIADQESYFAKTGSELDSAFNAYLGRLKGFCSRISMPSSDARQLEKMIQRAHGTVSAKVQAAEQTNEVRLGNRNSDSVLQRLEDLFTNRVGDPMKPDELKAARAEGKKRADDNIPPGYMDRDKSDPAGDYILWKQFMSEASTRKVPTVLITDDRKEDWIWREHGQTIGPRYQLREEMMSVAGVSFMIMPTSAFLVHAEKHLNVPVRQATVDQAKEIPDSLEEHRRHDAIGFLKFHMDRMELRRAETETQLRDVSAKLALQPAGDERERLRSMQTALLEEQASLDDQLTGLGYAWETLIN